MGIDILQGQTGLFVDEDGVMYVADSKQNMIFILDRDGTVIKQFGRPVEPLFGRDRRFLPRKNCRGCRKNLYIISEGSVDGIVQMNTNGNFIGYGAKCRHHVENDPAKALLDKRTAGPIHQK